MSYNPDTRHRRSIRLKEYDYSQPGAYFVTICTQERLQLFGRITENVFEATPAGIMIQAVWNEIPLYYSGVESGTFVVMPNHIHAIIEINEPTAVPAAAAAVGAGPRACPNATPRGCPNATPRACPNAGPAQETGQARGPAPTFGLSLSDIIHRYKTMTTKRYADGVKNDGWAPFPGKLWQRNYYEHIIRNDDDYNNIAEYIRNNPQNWTKDTLWKK